MKKALFLILALSLAVCLLVCAVLLPLHYGGVKEAWWALCGGKVVYPYVLVHGLGGWGENSPMNEHASYWGASTGSLPQKLRAQGLTVVAPSLAARVMVVPLIVAVAFAYLMLSSIASSAPKSKTIV